jgi:hypothetical protein
MAWDTDLVTMVRVLVDDINSPQTYTDEYLKRVIITAGIIVEADVPLDYDYSYDLDALTITPDPTVVGDDTFIALVPLKSTCILNQGEFKQALGQGIKVRDGDSAIDTSVSFGGWTDILKYGACAAYEKLRWSLLASGKATGGGAGKAVFGPNRKPGENALSTISWYYDRFATSDSRTDRS